MSNKKRVDVIIIGKKKMTITTEFIGNKSITEFFTQQAMKIVKDINNK